MIIAIVKLKSDSSYSQSRHHAEPKGSNGRESADDYEKRTWRKKLHVDTDGQVLIPPMAFKNCLSEAAKFMSIQIPGKGKATYTKHFDAGVLVTDWAQTGIHRDTVKEERLFLPSDGKRGSGKRVWKSYPLIEKWNTTVTFYIIDETITKDVFERHLMAAGQFIGIGRFRPRNNGYYGRFSIDSLDWKVLTS